MAILIPVFESLQEQIAYKDRTLKAIEQHIQTARDSSTQDEARMHYLEQAYQLLSDLLTLDKQDTNLWIKRAQLQQARGNFASALADARHAMQLQPRNNSALTLFVQLALVVHAGDTFLEQE